MGTVDVRDLEGLSWSWDPGMSALLISLRRLQRWGVFPVQISSEDLWESGKNSRAGVREAFEIVSRICGGRLLRHVEYHMRLSLRSADPCMSVMLV